MLLYLIIALLLHSVAAAETANDQQMPQRILLTEYCLQNGILKIPNYSDQRDQNFPGVQSLADRAPYVHRGPLTLTNVISFSMYQNVPNSQHLKEFNVINLFSCRSATWRKQRQQQQLLQQLQLPSRYPPDSTFARDSIWINSDCIYRTGLQQPTSI